METRKKRVMLHLIMPNQISGPNQSNRKIFESELSNEFEFEFLKQEFLAGGFINFRLINELRKQIVAFKPDLIHLSGLQSSCFHAVIAARLARIDNILIGVRGFSSDAIQLSFLKRMIFDHFIEPISLTLCKNFYTVAISMNQCAIVRRFSKKSLGTIHNVIPNIQISNDDETRVELGINKSDIIVIVVGRIIKDKGIDYIIDAIGKVRNPNIRFLFIGDGPGYPVILSRLHEDVDSRRVILKGKVTDTYRYLRVADIFLFATLHENLSNALLEAAAYKLACIVTNVGGNVEVVTHNDTGLLIKPGNCDDIVSALNYLIDNPEKIEEFGLKISNSVHEKFSQKEHFDVIKKTYLEMMKSHG